MMKKYTLLALLTLMAIACAASAEGVAQSSGLVKQYTDKIDELIPGMSDPDITKRKDPQQTLEKMCHRAGAPGKPEARAKNAARPA